MSVIVTDAGFAPAEPLEFVALADLGNAPAPVDMAATDDPAPLADRLADLPLIRIAFGAFGDGRGFTLAARLRRMGYAGRLRAHGPLLADQYAMARRCGFDEVEIPDDLAERQPADQWQFRTDWRAHDYQGMLRA